MHGEKVMNDGTYRGIEISQDNGEVLSTAYLYADDGLAYGGIGVDPYSNGHKVYFETSSTKTQVKLYADTFIKTLLEPTIADGLTPYVFDTSFTHISGNLLTVANNTTNKFSVDFDGAITTGDPGAGTAGWKLGTKVTGATVSLVTTNYVEVNIGGSIVKLAIVK